MPSDNDLAAATVVMVLFGVLLFTGIWGFGEVLEDGGGAEQAEAVGEVYAVFFEIGAMLPMVAAVIAVLLGIAYLKQNSGRGGTIR